MVRPCRFSRKVSPRAVYCPQYFDSSFLAQVCTAAMAAGISGTHTSSAAAAGTFTKHRYANSVSGASMA